MEQQRPFLYLSLVFLGFLIWSTWQQEHAPKPITPANSTVQQQTAGGNSIPSGSSVSVNGTDVIPSANSSATNAQAQQIHVKTDVLDMYISTTGGTIVQADLPTHPISLEEQDKATRIIDREMKYAAQAGLIYRGSNGESSAPNHYTNFEAKSTEYTLQDGQDTLQVPLTWSNGQGITVTKTFLFERGSFLVKQIQTVENKTDQVWSGNEYLELTHIEHERTGSLLGGAIAYVGPAYYNNKYDKIDFDEIKDGELKDLNSSEINALPEEEKASRLIQGGWIAMLKHYFVSAWVPSKEQINTYYTRYNKSSDNYIIGVKSPVKEIQPGTSGSFDSQLYVGPTDQATLAEISEGLDLTVDYGIFAFVSKPIFWVMSFINQNIVSNWGWTIILLTLFIKIIFFYPSAMSYKSMAKMKKLAPKIKEISEKYKNDPQAKQKETMAFYRKEKINPLGGCLPMLIQMPVFMGLYWVLQESVELRQAPWILWYQDLSIKDPFFILPLIMGASMFIQQKLNPPAVQDPMQQKIFTYLPVIFTVMFLFFPAGLVLYWVVNNILSIFQQWYINKKIIGDG
ncbi:membrane protein insertase YidC [uncultured Cocleimonas sp.]|uniref:membrane protein insertase YidC n=1 Tax=uncultured Cocleimonas sp. TaxID=1051587 RepID=UPI002615B306|nr:membrane protein insertase YidC [uncultured Cocleimonas sp.]